MTEVSGRKNLSDAASQTASGKQALASVLPPLDTRLGILGWGVLRVITVTLIAGILVGLRHLDPSPSPHSMLVHGLIDETGHVLTALMLGISIRALRLPIPLWSFLVGGVVLDGGHILTQIGATTPIAGSSRDGSHSLAVVALIGLIGLVDARRANIWLGVALGAMTHLVRDMGTGKVPLLWPAVTTVETTSFHRYLAVMVGVSVMTIGVGILLDTYRLIQNEDWD